MLAWEWNRELVPGLWHGRWVAGNMCRLRSMNSCPPKQNGAAGRSPVTAFAEASRRPESPREDAGGEELIVGHVMTPRLTESGAPPTYIPPGLLTYSSLIRSTSYRTEN